MATKHHLQPMSRPLKRNTGDDIWTTRLLRFASRIAIRDTVSSFAQPQADTATALVVPFSTVTVFDTTVVHTTFVTVHASDLASQPTNSGVRISRSSSLLSGSSSISERSSLPVSTLATLPSVIVDGPKPNAISTSSDLPAVMTPAGGVPESTAVPVVGKGSEQKSHKSAIIGGLSGTIAGLLLIGVIICLLLRRRRKQLARASGSEWGTSDVEPFPHVAEKGLVSAVIHSRPGTAVTRDSPGQAFQGQPGFTPAVDEDHRMIRMSTCHWPRPFALGAGEGYRESVPGGQLRCTNPDPSRPGTPQTASGSPQNFFTRKRSLLRNNSRSQPHQRHPLAQEIPTIKVVDPALSRECVSRYSNTPSFKSYPSISTVQVVHHRTPDDPFLTPTAEEPIENGEPQRPSGARSISTASRTWAHILHPLRNRSASCAETDVRASSHSVDTTSSSARFSRRSDPFDLDRQSRNWTAGSDGQPRGNIGGRSQILYEGT